MRWLVLALVVAGCGPTDQQVCNSYGYSPGDPGYGACMEQREQDRINRAAAAAAILSTMPQYQPPPVYYAPPVQQPHNYTCYRSGNLVNCSGY